MDTRPLLVLVAEDDADLRDAIEHVLASDEIRVSSAVDGQDALDRLERVAQGESPCAVLLDWVMPRVNGEAFLRARAASPFLSSIPVFVTSASHLVGPDARIQGFLPKPFEIDELLPMLRGVCDAHCPPERRARCLEVTPASPAP